MPLYPPTLDELASECTDRTTNPRGWVIARNYIEAVYRLERTLDELRELGYTLPPSARRILARKA